MFQTSQQVGYGQAARMLAHLRRRSCSVRNTGRGHFFFDQNQRQALIPKRINNAFPYYRVASCGAAPSPRSVVISFVGCFSFA
jgi:hypothetical protein